MTTKRTTPAHEEPGFIPAHATERQRRMLEKYDALAKEGNLTASVIALALRKKIHKEQPVTAVG